jgi:biopolymer transport protein ExbD
VFDLGPVTPLIVVAVVLYLLFIVALIVLTRTMRTQQPEASLPAEATVELPDGTVVSAEEAAALRRMQLKWLALPAKVH